MNDTYVTLIGNVVNEPVLRLTNDQVPVTSFRIASTPRRYDRTAGEWRDGDSLFVSVTCWRRLAEHVKQCVNKGDGVIVAGRLLMRTYEKDGERHSVYEVDATAVGPDLNRGTATLVRSARRDAAADSGPGVDGATAPAQMPAALAEAPAA